VCRQASFATLSGKAPQPYDDGRVQPGDDIPTITSTPCTAPPPTTAIVITASWFACSCSSPAIIHRLGEDAKLSLNMTKVKIYIPCVTRERARELVLQHIEHDPSLETLRELNEQDLAKPELDIITATGLKCVGVPFGTPEFVNAFVRSKAHAI
jgi:hypothetical protein